VLAAAAALGLAAFLLVPKLRQSRRR
jgi:hypothetical protein